jgi:hypothetical protein
VLLYALAALVVAGIVVVSVHLGGHGIGHVTRVTSAHGSGPVPLNTVLPVVSGSLNVGSTMTVTNGTWSNSPTSFSYQWNEGGNQVGTNANTYVSTTVGASIYCTVGGINAAGIGFATSASVGPVTGAGLATPTLTNFSALGTAPLTLEWSTTDYIAGDYAQLEIDQTSNAFGALTQNIIFFIDGASWALNDEAIGLVTPSGTYWARIRVCRENESGTSVTGKDPLGNSVTFNADVSSWSTIFTDMISASAAALNTTSGINKSSFMTVSGSPALTWAGTSGGGKDAVRTTIEQAANKGQFEVTINATGDLFVGIEDGTTDFSTLNKIPGIDNSAGFAVELNGTAGIGLWFNTSGTFADLGSAAGCIAVGDVFSFVPDKVNHTLAVYRTRSGATVQMGTTQSVPTLTHNFAFMGANSTNGGGTDNFGGSTFARTLGTGEALWG